MLFLYLIFLVYKFHPDLQGYSSPSVLRVSALVHIGLVSDVNPALFSQVSRAEVGPGVGNVAGFPASLATAACLRAVRSETTDSGVRSS